MFIPVSYGTGLTTVNCVVSSTGTLRAGCEVIRNSVTIPANTDIAVTRGDAVTLRTTISAKADIAVTLAGKSYTWAVDLPKGTRFVNDLAFKRITGTTYGKLYSYPAATSKNFAVSGTVSNTESLTAAIDYAKKEIWWFGPNGTKKVTTPDTPVFAVFTPRWSATENTPTTYYVVTEKFLYPVTASMDLDTANAVAIDGQGAIRAACGDSAGIILLSDTKLQRWVGGGITQIADVVAAHDVQVNYQDVVFVAQDDGKILRIPISAPGSVSTIYDAERPAKFVLDTNHATNVYATDLVNRMVIMYDGALVTKKNLDDVPSGIFYAEENVYVGLLTRTKTLKYNLDLSTVEEITTVKAQGFAYDGSLLVTDLYSDAADVTTAESTTTVTATQLDVPIDTASVISVTIPWSRPMLLTAEAGANVTLNDQPFTSGYVASPDVLKVTMPAQSAYYTSLQVDFFGQRGISVYFRTEPKLFPNKVVLPSVYDAFPKHVYSAEFDVAGLTEDFRTDLVIDSDVLTFNINGGAFGTEGNVKNGDHIIVNGVLKNLIALREKHNIVTLDDHVAAEWTLLGIQLNGAQVEHDKPVENNKFPLEWTEGDTVVPTTVDIDSSVMAQTMLATAEFQAVADRYSLDADLLSTYAMPLKPKDKVVERLVVPTVNGKTRYTATDVTAIAYKGRVQYNGDLTYTAQRLARTTALRDVEHVWAEQANTSIQVPEYARNLRVTSFEYEVDSETLQATTLAMDAVYQRGVQPKRSEQAPTHQRAVKLSGANIVPLYGTVGARLHFLVDFTYEVPVTLFRFLNAVYAVRFANAGRPISPTYGMSLAAKRVELSNTGVRAGVRHTHDIAEYDVETLQPKVLDPENDAVFVTHPTTVNSAPGYDVGRQAKRVETGDIEVARITSTRVEETVVAVIGTRNVGVELDMPTARWGTAHGDSTSEQGNGFFATQAEVEAYAETLNLEETTPPVFFQINGKWVLVSTPVADTAACFPTNLPPGSQKRFGYVGGG